jgi:predicted 2-oxoglutarate/Fe(II)-dependent dioxygenase YbiX
LYEKGGFFKPHRDTEKEDKMFATLIIQLPTEYEGGQLIVNHNGLNKKTAILKKLRQETSL